MLPLSNSYFLFPCEISLTSKFPWAFPGSTEYIYYVENYAENTTSTMFIQMWMTLFFYHCASKIVINSLIVTFLWTMHVVLFQLIAWHNRVAWRQWWCLDKRTAGYKRRADCQIKDRYKKIYKNTKWEQNFKLEFLLRLLG